MLDGRCSRRRTAGPASAGPDHFRVVAVRRVAAVTSAEDGGGPAVPERCGQGVAELAVVVLEPRDAVGGGVQAAQQRGVGGALPIGRDRGWGARALTVAEPLDLGSQIVLGVEPGTGDAGLPGQGPA